MADANAFLRFDKRKSDSLAAIPSVCRGILQRRPGVNGWLDSIDRLIGRSNRFVLRSLQNPRRIARLALGRIGKRRKPRSFAQARAVAVRLFHAIQRGSETPGPSGRKLHTGPSVILSNADRHGRMSVRSRSVSGNSEFQGRNHADTISLSLDPRDAFHAGLRR
jgi:hypothetical protein